MGIGKQIFFNKLFKISCICFFLQRIKNIQTFQPLKWFCIIIQPCIKHVNSVHQPFGEGGIICLTEAKLNIVNSCFNGFFKGFRHGGYVAGSGNGCICHDCGSAHFHGFTSLGRAADSCVYNNGKVNFLDKDFDEFPCAQSLVGTNGGT